MSQAHLVILVHTEPLHLSKRHRGNSGSDLQHPQINPATLEDGGQLSLHSKKYRKVRENVRALPEYVDIAIWG